MEKKAEKHVWAHIEVQEPKIEAPKVVAAEDHTKAVQLSKEDINIIINVLNIVGNGKYFDIIKKLRGE